MYLINHVGEYFRDSCIACIFILTKAQSSGENYNLNVHLNLMKAKTSGDGVMKVHLD